MLIPFTGFCRAGFEDGEQHLPDLVLVQMGSHLGIELIAELLHLRCIGVLISIDTVLNVNLIQNSASLTFLTR